MRLSPLVFFLFGVFACSAPDPESVDAGYGIHYPDHSDASPPETPGINGETPYIPPWAYKKWLVDPAPETTP